MGRFKEMCVIETTDSHIKFEENKKSIVFLNTFRDSFLRVRVDGCQITTGLRCDNLLVHNNTGDEYFVELKGVDIKHAISQIESTISQLSDKANTDKKIKAYVISANSSPSLRTVIQLRKKCFIKKHHAELIIKERKLEVNV